jgi:hypothetical protein
VQPTSFYTDMTAGHGDRESRMRQCLVLSQVNNEDETSGSLNNRENLAVIDIVFNDHLKHLNLLAHNAVSTLVATFVPSSWNPILEESHGYRLWHIRHHCCMTLSQSSSQTST